MLLGMQITLAAIGSRSTKKDGLEPLVQGYLERCSAWAQCRTEVFKTEEALLDWLGRQQGRTQAKVVLLDSRGRQMTSEAFAGWLGCPARRGEPAHGFRHRPGQRLVGSGAQTGASAAVLGQMTLAHALARLVMAEQIYRAYTILTGHPYHAGH